MARKSFADKMRTRFGVITTSIDKANLYIHDTAVMIVDYIKTQEEQGNRDGSLAQELVMALPASMRREMLILAFSRYTPIAVKNDEKFAGDVHKVGTKMRKEWDVEAFKANPFFRLAEDNKERAPIDAEKALALILNMGKRLGKDAEEGKVKPEDVDYIKAISAALANFKVARPKAANSNAKLEEQSAAG